MIGVSLLNALLAFHDTQGFGKICSRGHPALALVVNETHLSLSKASGHFNIPYAFNSYRLMIISLHDITDHSNIMTYTRSGGP